jgi:hypothetical protein
VPLWLQDDENLFSLFRWSLNPPIAPMDSVLNAVDSQLVLLIAAIAVVVLLSKLAFRILNVGLGPLIGLLVIFVALQYLFGISPKQVWFEVSHLPQMAMKFFQNLA